MFRRFALKRQYHTLFLALIAIVLLGVSAHRAEAQITPQNVSKIRFHDVNGQRLSLGQYVGRPILLHLWATWCAPCVVEIPLLIQLQKDYAPYGLTMLPISEDFDTEQVTQFFEAHGITNLPVLLDRDSQIFASLGTRGLPISILINRYGYEVQRFAGNTDWNNPQVRAMLNNLLSQ